MSSTLIINQNIFLTGMSETEGRIVFKEIGSCQGIEENFFERIYQIEEPHLQLMTIFYKILII